MAGGGRDCRAFQQALIPTTKSNASTGNGMGFSGIQMATIHSSDQ